MTLVRVPRCNIMPLRLSQLGQTRRSGCLGMSASRPTPDVSLQGNEPTLRAKFCREHLQQNACFAAPVRLEWSVMGSAPQKNRPGASHLDPKR